ncbi:SusC/RagA family TonB-linked outer membrane protein [Olivibacter ginsenosidimutans]|uniref:SusC/RagA family TonB-linked outer membrane protein n=1 Tax=Olivibacter ginsenosidimutans TaxID=1176537 RepID=A0ABP9AV49_9SPHI
MKKIIYFLCLLCPCTAFAQSGSMFQIKGTIVAGHSQKPLADVTILDVTTGGSIKSDGNGQFTLSVKRADTAIIRFSAVDYEIQQLKLSPPFPDALLIQMDEKRVELEEVNVTTGYQEIPKERSTGSFEQVDHALFNRQISTDVLSRLDGLMAGVAFDKRNGTAMNFNIRGLSTITSRIAKPLIVVDNFPYEGDINNINPNDIESVTVLKDAAATSIWGARAGNGVMVIKTKAAKFNQPFHLSLNTNWTVTAKPDLFYTPQMSTADFVDTEVFLFEKGVYDSYLSNTRTWPIVSPVVELLDKNRKGDLSEAALQTALNNLKQQDIRNDINRYWYQNGVNRQYALDLSGGGQKVNYRMGLGYDDNASTLKRNGYQRLTLKTQNNFQINRALDAQVGIQYTESKRVLNNKGTTMINPATGYAIYPYARLVDDKGNPTELPHGFRKSFLDTVGNGRLLDWSYSPLKELDMADHYERLNDLLVNMNLRYTLSPNLHIEAKYQYEKQFLDSREHFSGETFYARDLINRFTVFDGETNRYNIPVGGVLDRSNGDLKSHSGRLQIDYNNTWAEKHEVAFIGGAEIRQTTNTSAATRSYGYDDDVLTSVPVDYVTLFPIVYGLASATTIPWNDSYSGSMNRFLSFYANGSYTYNRRYVLSASARRDASNLFGVETNRKWNPFWSVGGAWNLSAEDFYRISFLPYAKVRATYGYSGNVNNDIAGVTTIAYRPAASYNLLPYANLENVPNPDLRWEQVGQLNVGLELATKGNRLMLDIEYYRKKATDLIASVPADLTTGFRSLTMNSAILQTNGWDATLQANVLQGKLAWNSVLTGSVNKNKVVRYLKEQPTPANWVSTGTNLIPIEGQPAYSVVSYRWGGLDGQTGDPMGYVNGELSKDYVTLTRNATADDLVFHGSALPQYFGAWRNTLRYRGWSLSVNVTYKFDYYFRKETIMYAALLSNRPALGHGDYYQRWQQPGDEQLTTVPSLKYPADTRRDQFYANSAANVEKGDHIRLKDIQLSYLLPLSQKESSTARNLRFTYYVNNVGILWRANKSNFDPDFLSAPLPLTMSLGLTLDL